MKRLSVASLLVLLAMACASAPPDDARPIDVHIIATDLSPEFLRIGGNVNTQLQVEVTNSTDAPVTLTSLEVGTIMESVVRFSTGFRPFKTSVAAHDSARVSVTAWGQSLGGRQAVDEPIRMRGIARFSDASGRKFQKVFTETLGR